MTPCKFTFFDFMTLMGITRVVREYTYADKGRRQGVDFLEENKLSDSVLIYAFGWQYTKEGGDFWDDMDGLWREIREEVNEW